MGTATLLDAIRAPGRAANVALIDASGRAGALTFGDLAERIADVRQLYLDTLADWPG